MTGSLDITAFSGKVWTVVGPFPDDDMQGWVFKVREHGHKAIRYFSTVAVDGRYVVAEVRAGSRILDMIEARKRQSVAGVENARFSPGPESSVPVMSLAGTDDCNPHGIPRPDTLLQDWSAS